MTAQRLPHLSDNEKQELCLRLERWGLLRRNHGRWVLTTEGHIAGSLLAAVAIFEQHLTNDGLEVQPPPLQSWNSTRQRLLGGVARIVT
jgi:hypothetical protein